MGARRTPAEPSVVPAAPGGQSVSAKWPSTWLTRRRQCQAEVKSKRERMYQLNQQGGFETLVCH
jgi:hypothetical protein